MRMPIGNLPQVIAEYFDVVVLPAASRAGGAAPFAAGLAGGLIARQAPAIATRYLSMAQALGVADAQGSIDIDLLYSEAAKALAQHPLVVAGYCVNKDDLDRLKTIMEKYGS